MNFPPTTFIVPLNQWFQFPFVVWPPRAPTTKVQREANKAFPAVFNTYQCYLVAFEPSGRTSPTFQYTPWYSTGKRKDVQLTYFAILLTSNDRLARNPDFLRARWRA